MPNIIDVVTTPDGTCTVHLFTPDGPGSQAPWPGVVMYPDAGGVRGTFEQMAAKLAGFQLGRHYRLLPRGLCRRLGMHTGFWGAP